jgi:hypothetical protein
LTHVHAVRTGGQGYIDPIIDDQRDSVRGQAGAYVFGGFDEAAGCRGFFPELHTAGTGAGGLGDHFRHAPRAAQGAVRYQVDPLH